MASQATSRTTILMGNPVPLVGAELKVGDKAPDFSVVDNTLQAVDLAGTGSGVRVFSVVPSLDTPVCDAQTRRFEDEAGKLSDVKFYTISMDLPFTQKRWCGANGIDNMAMLSDHRTGSFGEAYGTMIQITRIESRAIFVIDASNTIVHVEYVPQVGDHPNYEAALNAAKQASARGAKN